MAGTQPKSQRNRPAFRFYCDYAYKGHNNPNSPPNIPVWGESVDRLDSCKGKIHDRQQPLIIRAEFAPPIIPEIMKSYEEIIRATAALDWRIRTHMPENYMEEIFGQTRESDPNLYNRLWWAMRTGGIQFLLETLDYTNEKKLTRYISQKA